MEKFATKLRTQREMSAMRKITLLIAGRNYGPTEVAEIEAELRAISDPARLLEIADAIFAGSDAETSWAKPAAA